MRLIILFLAAITAFATPTSSADVWSFFQNDQSGRYVGYPSAEGNLWLLDTQTGSLAWCVQAKSVNDVPTCSPWAKTPGDEAAYRWDPDAKKLIPLNDAARKKEANDPLGIR